MHTKLYLTVLSDPYQHFSSSDMPEAPASPVKKRMRKSPRPPGNDAFRLLKPVSVMYVFTLFENLSLHSV